jgi:5-methylcytosine-specific restriction endonuclease McrA
VIGKLCTVCGAFVPNPPGGSRCPRHPKTKLPRDRWYRDQRERILRASTNCGICGQPFTSNDPAVLDHIVPRAYGGGHQPWNLQAAHRTCNARKSAQLPPQ